MTDLNEQKKALVDFTQEIRFAVVMYGGSSLAIYMNGVAQELLRLVRATAPALESHAAEDEESGEPSEALYQEVSGSELVYRKLGRMLSRGVEPNVAAKDSDTAPIRTRFVIDILSGTSAGGINAVFLAKALANNQQMDQLKQMWVEQGDIGVLINDKESDAGINLGTQDPPRSLLNCRRMYYQLLDALQRMDKATQANAGKVAGGQADPAVSPFVDELDLFTTGTDIWGQNISIRLADAVARERRHLNTFHFRYSSKQASGVYQNDFTHHYNPFLAFAARVTSAHPAPFEPMKLADIDEVLDRHDDYRNVAGSRSDDPRWEAFFEEYLQRPDDDASSTPTAQARTGEERRKMREVLAKKFRTRPFSDGGVLDNSPFSFAIDKLQFRHTRLPVDRKLIYIEPVPEHPEKELPPNRPPDALANAWLSLSTLPSYQFIRDDLHRLLERNRLIERVNRILQGVERDEVERMKKHREAQTSDPTHQDQTTEPLTSYEFGGMTVGQMIERMGSAWGGYQRLRVSETTDELVTMIGRAAGFDEQSDEYVAIRYLVRTWRFQNYDAYRDGFKGYLQNELPPEQVKALKEARAEKKDSENFFLYQYDLKWRLRRLKFVLSKAEEISCLDQHALDMFSITSDASEVERMLGPAQQAETPSSSGTAAVEEFSVQERVQRELRRVKHQLGDVLRDLHVARHQLFSRSSASRKAQANGSSSPPVEGNPLEATIEGLDITADELLKILDKATDHDREQVAEDILRSKKKEFDVFLAGLNNYLKEVMDKSAARLRGEDEFQGRGILEAPDSPPSPLTPEYLVRRTLRYFYENFDRYDVISYPILYSTNVGEETDTIEVFRISPEDARVLVDDEELRRRKLAGTSLGNFGAFFDRDFRTNDILWGRLDCADRIITALLSSASPDSDEEQQALEHTRQELVKEASRAIIAEELSATDKASLRGLLSAAMAGAQPGEAKEQFITELRKLLEERTPDLSKMQGFLSDCLTGKDPLQQFIETNNFNHELPPAAMVRTSARASKVFGKMLEGIADLHRMDKKRVVWVTRLAQLFWGLVEVATPDSIPNLLFRHWLKLLYLFEFLLVLGGTLLLNAGIQQFGLLTFAITVVIHAATQLLGDYMLGADKKEPLLAAPDTKSPTASPPAEKTKGGSPMWWRVVKGLFVTALVLMAVLGIVFLFTVLGAQATPQQSSGQPQAAANFIWDKIAAFRGWLARDEANGWNVKTLIRFAIVAFIGLFFLWSIRSDLRALFKGEKKS